MGSCTVEILAEYCRCGSYQCGNCQVDQVQSSGWLERSEAGEAAHNGGNLSAPEGDSDLCLREELPPLCTVQREDRHNSELMSMVHIPFQPQKGGNQCL